jgi:uncharacterized membrane protein
MAEFHVLGSGDAYARSEIRVRQIALSEIVDALRMGIADFMEKPSHYAFVVLMYPIIGAMLFVVASRGNAFQLIYPLLTGFALLGPIAVLGLYEISRRRELGLDTSWSHAFEVYKSPAIPAIAAVGAVLLVLFLAWIYSAQTLYGWLFAGTTHDGFWALATDVFGTSRGWALIVLGNAVGFVFALVVLCSTVVAFPLLLDRDVGAVAAIATSWAVVRKNPVPVLFWGLIVAVLLLLGALPGLVGLIVVLPVLGHATWHIYRKTVVIDKLEPRPVLR